MALHFHFHFPENHRFYCCRENEQLACILTSLVCTNSTRRHVWHVRTRNF